MDSVNTPLTRSLGGILSAPSAGPRRGALVAGKYRIKGLLGHGGMGSVWRATHEDLESEIAIKFMHPAMAANADARMRFSREARAAARLRTQHAAHIYDHGIDGGSPYIAMELMEGEGLSERLRARGRLPLPQAADIFEQAAKGLQAAHDLGVLHRDIKPSNIFIQQIDGGEVVKLLDFGVARLTHESICTDQGALVGSFHFMSPEQAHGEVVDARSDLWSLTVVAFCMVTGKRPFTGQTPQQVIDQIRLAPAPFPSDVDERFSPQLDAFFMRAFARERADRFQDARSLATAFRIACEDATAEEDHFSLDPIPVTDVSISTVAGMWTDNVVSEPANHTRTWLAGAAITVVAASLIMIALPAPESPATAVEVIGHAMAAAAEPAPTVTTDEPQRQQTPRGAAREAARDAEHQPQPAPVAEPRAVPPVKPSPAASPEPPPEPAVPAAAAVEPPPHVVPPRPARRRHGDGKVRLSVDY